MQFFITSTGTNAGKTYVVENLCRSMIQDGIKCHAIKPIISGFDEEDEDNDTIKILKSLNKSPTNKNISEISPYRFKAPLSPNIAAKLEDKIIDFNKVVDFCQQQILEARNNNKYLFVEGAGGVMTPINNNKSFIDLVSTLNIPAILVIENYLGTISHTLTALQAMKVSKIKIHKIILNSQNNKCDSYQEVLQTIRNFTEIEIVENIKSII